MPIARPGKEEPDALAYHEMKLTLPTSTGVRRGEGSWLPFVVALIFIVALFVLVWLVR
ncbi:MAG: hypothetical protein ACT4OI_07830 [Methanobacteriota archaeon]